MSKTSNIVKALKVFTSSAARPSIVRFVESMAKQQVASCPACGFLGQFSTFGDNNRPRAQCPRCKCLERHRLFHLADMSFQGKDVLHFAPEGVIRKSIMSSSPKSYVTADLVVGRADVALNIEKIDKPDSSLDAVVCLHVLEHVNDVRALSEIFRILRPGGILVAMVPIVEGWERTHEDATIIDRELRRQHFLQGDHVRLYGADFRERLVEAGFSVREYTADGSNSVKFALQRGEKIFFGEKKLLPL